MFCTFFCFWFFCYNKSDGFTNVNFTYVQFSGIFQCFRKKEIHEIYTQVQSIQFHFSQKETSMATGIGLKRSIQWKWSKNKQQPSNLKVSQLDPIWVQWRSILFKRITICQRNKRVPFRPSKAEKCKYFENEMERKRWIECIKKWIACGSATPTTMKAKTPSNLACFVFMCTLHSTQKLTLAQNWLRCIGCEYQLSSITKYIHMSDDFWLFFCAAQQQQWQQPKKRVWLHWWNVK